MPGPDILTASLTPRGVTTGQQYNSRSDWPGYANGLPFIARRYCGLWGRGT